MKQIATHAIILKRLNFGEADRILTVLTPKNGKISILAKGVRKPKSKLAGGLELFSVTEITYIDGKSNLKTLVSSRLKTHYKNITKDIATTMTAYDVLKYSEQYSEYSNDELYFELCNRALAGLDAGKVTYQTVFVWYCVRLLAATGNGINVEKPFDTALFSDDTNYDFLFEEMSFGTRESGLFRPSHIKLLRLMMKSDNSEKLATITNIDTMTAEVFTVFKQIMQQYRT